ncbi:N-acetyl-alpha-D-glucosaminyl L-malate synthase BshA [Nibricoccus aquaticus]|uniref:N-acetyl-alpha-D-glucosaminyl L-malate synthase BshA n=1 Tax=Nibricoccus aquaticus TaxID=2576891 RepID=A0A290QI21_9BACT|nr:N-acetyl-alpha-D-glucosaminyl L-malate synthase BshA [Nibricoccus aquaticus]ATC64001.1 N-acetyl-alpha-D-glucosaminyl L-malate synthase BshA [Nibricoccus aquaticus]
MSAPAPLKIGITCYPSVGGSGILASALGEELARLGHEVHFISYERPFRMPANAPRLFFHPVDISDYGLFKYPDYTLPLSVKMAEVSREHRLDILHVHYAVPHATAALLARDMLPPELRPKIVATLHGTDTTLLGKDPAYAPAIRHALEGADAITTVSHFLKAETLRLLGIIRPIDVIHNFFEPRPPKESRDSIRAGLGLKENEALILHASNLRPLKRIDLLLETAARIRPADAFKLVILAGGDFEPFLPDILRLGLQDRVVVRTNVPDIEDYFAAADLALFTSETESFCLSILEAMAFACPSVTTDVGGIPEVVDHNLNGLRVPFGDPDALALAAESLLADPPRRTALGNAAREKARTAFSAATIVPQYLALYHRVRNK